MMTTDPRSGCPARGLGAAWRKSSYSGAVGNCVELAWLERDRAAVRTSRNPDGPALICSRVDLAAFVADAKRR